MNVRNNWIEGKRRTQKLIIQRYGSKWPINRERKTNERGDKYKIVSAQKERDKVSGIRIK